MSDQKRWYLFFDCETGGLDHNFHSLLTVYFGIYDMELNLMDELYLQLKPSDITKLHVEKEALQVTGIDIEKHINDPKTITYEQGRILLANFLEKYKIKGKKKHYTPCGHNIVPFDINFIQSQLMTKDQWEKYVHHNPIDTLKIVTFLIDIDFLPSTLGKLDSLVQYFNIPMGQAHHAREDIRMTVDVYKSLTSMLKSKKLENTNIGNNSLLEIIER